MKSYWTFFPQKLIKVEKIPTLLIQIHRNTKANIHLNSGLQYCETRTKCISYHLVSPFSTNLKYLNQITKYKSRLLAFVFIFTGQRHGNARHRIYRNHRICNLSGNSKSKFQISSCFSIIRSRYEDSV